MVNLWYIIVIVIYMGLSENRLNPIVPNGFADHEIPMKNGYVIGNINPTFSDKPIWK